jgi:hypothetical protein
MPLMSLELLKFPSLCLQYFKTVTFVCELYPEKICALNPDLQKNLVASLELGLTTVGVDTVYSLCCDFIQESILWISISAENFVDKKVSNQKTTDVIFRQYF